MKLSRSLAIGLLLFVLGGMAVHQAAPTAQAAGTATASPAVAGSGTATEPAVHKPGGLVDANSVFFGCAAGAVVGALVTALPPLVGWTFYAGALPAIMALMASSGVGCTVGLFGGVILSTVHWMTATIGSAWSAVFG